MAKTKTIVFNGYPGGRPEGSSILDPAPWMPGEQRTLYTATADWVLAANPGPGEGDPLFSVVKDAAPSPTSSGSPAKGA